MSDDTTPQDDAAMSPASAGSVGWQASGDADRRLAARLHGIADHSMAIIIGSMIQEMIFELKMRKSPGYPGHISFTLTDAEREAIAWAINVTTRTYDDPDGGPLKREALRCLLERTK